MKKYLSLFLLTILIPLNGCALFQRKAEVIPVLPPKVEIVDTSLKDYKDKVKENNQAIVAEAQGVKVLADNSEKPGVPAAIKDSADLIIKKAGGDTTAKLQQTVEERVISAVKGLGDQYHTLYVQAMNDSDAKIKALTESNDKLTQSLANSKAEYESKTEGLKAQAAIDLAKQKQVDETKAKKDAKDASDAAFRDTLKLCISIASLSSLIAIGLIVARFYLASIIPARAPFIFFGIAATVMAYAMLANQWWFPYILGTVFVIGIIESYKYFKSVTGHLINLAQYSKLAFELVAGVQKYIKDNNITDEQKKASPIFIAIASALSPESKAVVEQIKVEYAAKNLN